MTENVLALGDILGLLMQLLHARHIRGFLGLLHPVANEHDASPHVHQRNEKVIDFLPAAAIPATRRRNGRNASIRNDADAVPDPGRWKSPEVIGTNHQTDNDDNEPFEGSGAGKASSKCGQYFIHKSQHRLVDRHEIG